MSRFSHVPLPLPQTKNMFTTSYPKAISSAVCASVSRPRNFQPQPQSYVSANRDDVKNEEPETTFPLLCLSNVASTIWNDIQKHYGHASTTSIQPTFFLWDMLSNNMGGSLKT